MSLCVTNGEKAFRKNMDQIKFKNFGEPAILCGQI